MPAVHGAVREGAAAGRRQHPWLVARADALVNQCAEPGAGMALLSMHAATVVVAPFVVSVSFPLDDGTHRARSPPTSSRSRSAFCPSSW